MAFRVGQKVVYVGGCPVSTDDSTILPRLCKGKVYTIREMESAYFPYTGMLHIRVEEMFYAPMTFRGKPFEPAHPIGRFRPIVDVSTDTGMAILEQIRRDVSNKILRPIFEDEQV